MSFWSENFFQKTNEIFVMIFALGAVYKLRLQEEGVFGQQNRLFVNFYTIENVNGGG